MSEKYFIKLNLNSGKYIYALLLPISCMTLHFFQEIMIQDDNEILKYNLPFLFYYFLPKLLSLIIIPIIKSRNRSETIVKDQNKVIRRYHFSIEKENRKKILLLIYFISLLEVLYKTGDTLLYYLYKIGSIKLLIEKRTGFIIFVPLFSFFILHKKLFNHHLFALFLALSGALFIQISRMFLKISQIDDYIYHLINLFFSCLFALSLVLIKYLMTKFIILSPYNFLLYDGIFCIINSILCPFLEYIFVINIDEDINASDYFKKNYLGIFEIFKGKGKLFIISFFISFIFSFAYFIFNVLTIFYFSPYLNVLTDFLTPFFLSILIFIFFPNLRETKRFFLDLIGYVIIIFGALILNEIIILNCFGLNDNTYSTISDRGKMDATLIGEIDPNAENEDIDEDNNDNNGNIDKEEKNYF